MGTPSSFFDEKNADANADGVVNAADIVRIANIINGAELYCPPSVPWPFDTEGTVLVMRPECVCVVWNED